MVVRRTVFAADLLHGARLADGPALAVYGRQSLQQQHHDEGSDSVAAIVSAFGGSVPPKGLMTGRGFAGV